MTEPLDDARGELLPCPFCGCSEASVRPCGGSPGYWIKCGNCGAESDDASTPEWAAKRWNTRAAPARCDAEITGLPKPETMRTYANILEKPQYWIDPKTGQKYQLATGEIVKAACAALRYCAALSTDPGTGLVQGTIEAPEQRSGHLSAENDAT